MCRRFDPGPSHHNENQKNLSIAKILFYSSLSADLGFFKYGHVVILVVQLSV